MKKSVLLVGSYPPPYGGCSVHVKRLREALCDMFTIKVVDLYGTSCEFDDEAIIRCGARRPNNAWRAIFALRKHAASLVHFHVAGMDAFLSAAYPLLAVLRRGTHKIVTIHSGSFVARFQRGPAWRRIILRNVLRRFDAVVTVNCDQRAFLEEIGISSSRVFVIPAFLPPVARESARAREIVDSVRKCDQIIVSSGYGFSYYGFHHIIDALDLLRTCEQRYGLLLCMYNSYDEAYVTELERRLANGFCGLIVRDLEPEEFAWVLERCDLYVRATDRDGDAVGIREALFYRKVVVASDCVERPAAVHLFKTNDFRSLARAISATGDGTQPSPEPNEAAGLSALLELYREVLTA